MRIVQYMLGFRSADGGVVRSVIDLCEALSRRGHDVRVLTLDDSDAPRVWDGMEGRPSLTILKRRRFLGMLIDGESRSTAEAEMTGADVVHLHVPWDPVCAQLAGLARRRGVPYVVTVHGMLDDWTMGHRGAKKRAYLAAIGRTMLEGAATIHCAASVEAEQSRKWYPRGRSTVTPLLFDLDPYRQLPGPDLARQSLPINGLDSRPMVLAVGRLHPIKRIELLLDAVGRLRDSNEADAPIVCLAGTGAPEDEQSLRQAVIDRTLESIVRFAGFVNGQAKVSLYQAADVLVHPSAHESFGYAMVESLASGTPVLTTRAVNIWPELEASGGALIAEPSPGAMADALSKLLSAPLKMREMGATGRQWVLKYLEPARLVGQYEDMYRHAGRDE